MNKEIKKDKETEEKSMKLIKERQQRILMKQRAGSLREKKINKIDKPLGRVTRKRQNYKPRNETWHISKNPANTKKIREYYELYTIKIENLDKTD